MLHVSHNINGDLAMSRGNSGRVVLEIDPELKRQLYTALTHEGLTLKDWFLTQAGDYVRNYSQLSLQLVAEQAPQPYKKQKARP